ncbi:YeeE/YedE family protein [Pseudogulbenkiania sp. MAI-1]|uniref:YeeE/YedE family protein n=1 Tax=Pseudogulbenkiania sp. MAI-1 TaxID=990370 RepID=UPI00045E868D|nr:YeeE/YedE family protein [Pseudogulbenkiania sp. MAI-1]
MKKLSAFAAGLVFGLGLIVSGMANPVKVLGFLDLAGAWDPSLALVMVGAIGVALLPFQWAQRHKTSWLGEPLHLPGSRAITPRLVVGSVLFGIGWGLAGLCPGPALVLLGTLSDPALLFVLAMLAGMAMYRWLERPRA